MIYQVHFGIHDGVLGVADYSLPSAGRGFTGGIHPYAKFAPLYHLKFSRWGLWPNSFGSLRKILLSSF